MTDETNQVEEIERTRGAQLPHRDADPIMRLYAHYFEPTDFMLARFRKIDRQADSVRGLSRAQAIERRFYLMYWLSSLYVVLEGMEQMPIVRELEKRPLEMPALAGRVVQVLADFEDHREALRRLRNAQSHYQRTASKHLQFFDTPLRIDWAEILHLGVGRVLSDYRVQCAVVCAFAGRKDEIDIKRARAHPSRHHRLLTD